MHSISSNLNVQDVNKIDEVFNRTGSFRKVLPTTPSTSTDSRLSMSMKMIDRPNLPQSPNNGSRMYVPYILEYSIIAEYQLLQKQDLPGVYVIPSEENPWLWFGVIFVRQGLYQGGVFRFSVHIPPNYPDGGCPKIIFSTKIFHPAVDESGELNVTEEFYEWKKKVNQIWHVLQYTRKIFYTIETKVPFNKVAAEMFLRDSEMFKERVRQCVEASKMEAFLPSPHKDSHYIQFEEYNESIHNSVRDEIIQSPTLEKIQHF